MATAVRKIVLTEHVRTTPERYPTPITKEKTQSREQNWFLRTTKQACKFIDGEEDAGMTRHIGFTFLYIPGQNGAQDRNMIGVRCITSKG